MLDTSPPSSTPVEPPASRLSRALLWVRAWPYTFGIALSVAAGIVMYVMGRDLGRNIGDPEGFLGPAYVRLPAMAIMLLAADIVPRSLGHAYKTQVTEFPGSGALHKVKSAFQCVLRVIPSGTVIVREQWSWKRVMYSVTGLIVFYLSYVSYRNIKSFLPLYRDGLEDHWMLKVDHALGFGNYPHEILFNILGTGISAQFLSVVYVFYLPLIPITLAAMLVWNKDLSRGAWYATALALNWLLGAVSYYLIPTLGPAFAQEQGYWELPETGVTALQQSLFNARVDFQTDLTNVSSMQGIAGFASLHVSVVLTMALIVQRLGYVRWLRIAVWAYFVCTVLATVYFGWHYVLDDVGGALIGWLSVVIGAKVTGQPGWRERKALAEAQASERTEEKTAEAQSG